EVRTGVMVKDIDKEGLTVETHAGTHRLEARTVIWAGGVTVPPLGKTLASRTKAETDRSGRIKVGSQLTVANYPNLYVIGDLALALNHNGMPLPGFATAAMQQGPHAA